MKIYHYTTIETLALILKNRNIRFNRLDKVDDLEEARTKSNGLNLAQYRFISCWTKSEEESIPLWKMYTNNGIGVRIGLEQKMFKEYDFKHQLPNYIKQEGEMQHLFPIDAILSKDYFIVPLKYEAIFMDIDYVSDIDRKSVV